jgi:hypothetical protein
VPKTPSISYAIVVRLELPTGGSTISLLTAAVERVAGRSPRSTWHADRPAELHSGRSEACRGAGLRKVRLHGFRHGAVSVLLGLGVPPRTTMDIVGHTTLEITMTVYGHVSLDEKREAVGKVGDLFEEGLRWVRVISRRSLHSFLNHLWKHESPG